MTSDLFFKDDMECLLIVKRVEMYIIKIAFDNLSVGLNNICESIKEVK